MEKKEGGTLKTAVAAARIVSNKTVHMFRSLDCASNRRQNKM